MTEKSTKTCPYCAEEILEAAVKCKHCGEFLEDSEQQSGVDKGASSGTSFAIANLALVALAMISMFLPWVRPGGTVTELEDTTAWGASMLLALALLGVLNLLAVIQGKVGSNARIFSFLLALGAVAVVAGYGYHFEYKDYTYQVGFYLGAVLAAILAALNLASLIADN